jgi:hypothetical protein
MVVDFDGDKVKQLLLRVAGRKAFTPDPFKPICYTSKRYL